MPDVLVEVLGPLRNVPQPGPNSGTQRSQVRRLLLPFVPQGDSRFTSRWSRSRAVPDPVLLLHRLGDRLNVPGPAESIVSLATAWPLTEVGSHAYSPSGHVS
jgi:hypothetical protein